MKKVLLIAQRDFFSRIRNRSFIISTLLLPIGIVIFYGAIFYFSSHDSDHHNIAVDDHGSGLASHYKNDENYSYFALDSNEKDIEDYVLAKKITAIIDLPRDIAQTNQKVDIITYEKIGPLVKSSIEESTQKIVEKARESALGLDTTALNSLTQPLDFKFQYKNDSEDSSWKDGLAYALGFGLGIMMYVILTIYGSQVMRGVMEEKTNRIVEIIISSVKPYQLLLGKILGIGMVSFVQLSFWGICMLLINLVLGLVLGSQVNLTTPPAGMESMSPMASSMQSPEIQSAFEHIQNFDFLPIFIFFIIYFIGGFLLYSSMFASVGSAVNDDPQDAQSLMFPIMMPIFFSFVLLTKAINNPNSTAAVVGSLVPFTSPVVMMSRLVYGIPDGVPLWQVILSIVLLYSTTFLFIVLAARIYRIGILLYGKKVGWKDIVSWVFAK